MNKPEPQPIKQAPVEKNILFSSSSSLQIVLTIITIFSNNRLA